MKIGLLFVLICNLCFGQKNQEIRFYRNINDKTKSVKSITVLDARKNSDLGFVTFKKDNYSFSFENGSLKDQFERWFKADKAITRDRELILYVEKFRFFSESLNKGDLEKVELKLTVFEKKFGEYYYLNRLNDVMLLDPNKTENTPRGFSKYIDDILADFLKESYEITRGGMKVTDVELPNYENILQSDLELFKNSDVKNGIYKDYKTFFNQEPVSGYELVKNSKGEVTKAKSNTDKISANDLYAFVENGIAYKPTIAGNLEIQKDEKGFFILTNRLSLFPQQTNDIYVMFGMFGLVGGVVGGVVTAIHQNNKHNKAMKDEKYQVYLDALTGKYIFPE
ncbi:hypothetical protein [Chryseobacterium sp. FH1]|uniref:hypothetical protein n=1 Tax=Chryseobacterium sp. FH1 TaxID=1233951 RepID=UPI0004E4678C|nr:hypothetical protein [Chryseobacterium sp. FH1]KFC24377.1 hypothetical protein IO90_03510 [Chryseobacterium sp. FH1]